MKKLLVSLMIGALLLAGCAGMQVAKQTTQVPYYETMYWGEEKSCEKDGGTFVGRLSKTYQVYPAKDMFWVEEENGNGDDVEVTLVWDMPEAPVLGVCFYLDQTKEENCGVLMFDSLTGKQLFVDEFDKSGITNAVSLPAMRQELDRQIRVTEKYTVGEDADYCEWIDSIMGE